MLWTVIVNKDFETAEVQYSQAWESLDDLNRVRHGDILDVNGNNLERLTMWLHAVEDP